MRTGWVILELGILIQCLQIFLADGANIMFFFGISSYSHRVGAWPLVSSLSDRGHSVTFVSPFKSKVDHPKVIDYVPTSLKEWVETWNETGTFYENRLANRQDVDWWSCPDYGLGMCQVLLNDPQYVDWINSSKFDLVFVDALWNECAYAMAYKLKAKIIVINTADMFPHFHEPFGIPDESSWVPDLVYAYPMDMTFRQRLVTLLVPLYFNYLREVHYFPKLEALAKDKLGIAEMPGLSEIERDVSLVFLNHNWAEDYARPFPPNVVPIGGMLCSNHTETLPKDLEDFISKGKCGFIYISFGSYAELSLFPKQIQDAFLNSVKKLKDIQFIWKLDLEEMKWTDLPQNVYPAKWMPQKAILAHPKAKAFITHAGLLGIQEAICNAVPLIAFPIFAEQDYNAVKLATREIGLKMEITTITQELLENAIYKILNSDKYRENMRKVSRVFKDRPVKPVETAVWWTEFVLRHDDTHFLRPASIKQSWWKRRQLDILAILFLALLIVIKVVYTIISFTFHLLFRTGKKGQKDGKKLKSS